MRNARSVRRSRALVYDVLSAGLDHGLTGARRLRARGDRVPDVNLGLLSTAMGLSEGVNPLAVWRERFRWLTLYYLASGPLAFAMALAYDRMGVDRARRVRVAARVHDVLRAAVPGAHEQVRRGDPAANDDLQTLFEFAGGLAACAHDSAALRPYAERRLSSLLGARVRDLRRGSRPEAWRSHGRQDGGLAARSSVREGQRRAVARGSATPSSPSSQQRSRARISSTRCGAPNRDMIAALSRSMEAKDYYTGGHTERVSRSLSRSAERLGYTGAELAAIEIGSLVHDIGKIGIPESILNKPGPLDRRASGR